MYKRYNNSSERLSDIEEKIKKIKEARDKKTQPFYKQNILSAWTVISELLAGLILGLLLGVYLDRLLHTTPIFLMICTILGSYGGLYNLYKTTMAKLAKKNKIQTKRK